jgi:hypothetical protein
MPMISGRHDGRALFLDALVLPHQSDVPLFYDFKALIDTGSHSTCIAEQVIHRLGLRPFGIKQMGNVYSVANHRTFLIRLGFSVSNSGLYVLPKTIVAPEIRSMDHFDVLIGMDVISQGDLTVARNGTFQFSFEAA